MEKPRVSSGRRLRYRMVTQQARRLKLPACALAESPLWHQETNEFVFCNLLEGKLYACSPQTAAPRLLLSYEGPLGAYLFDTSGDLILLTQQGVFFCPYGAGCESFRLLWKVPMDLEAGERFNDAIVDAEGRILAGTKTEHNRNGTLWQLQPGKPPQALLTSLSISNGMGFSADGKIFYHTDSGHRTISRYAYAQESGCLSDAQPLIQIAAEEGFEPDGLTVDAQNCLVVACWGGSSVRRYSPAGALMSSWSLPARLVSSVAFGGTSLRTLMVTTAFISLAEPQSEDGGVFLLLSEIPGREEFRARL